MSNIYFTRQLHCDQMKVEQIQVFNIKTALPEVFPMPFLCGRHLVFCSPRRMVKKGLFKSKISRFQELITGKSNIQLAGNKWSVKLTREITTIRQPITYSGFKILPGNLLHIKIGPKQGIFSIFDLPPSS